MSAGKLSSDEVVNAVRNGRSALDAAALELARYSSDKAGQFRHQALFFAKPELTEARDLEGALAAVDERLAAHSAQIGALRVVNGPYLREHETVERHYGVINRIAREGDTALSAQAAKALTEQFGDRIVAGTPVVGAFELMDAVDVGAARLAELVDAAGSIKLASGTYCCELTFGDNTFLVLNGFHPAQIDALTAPGKVLVVFEVNTDQAWKALREQVVGATNPAKARDGSIRAVLRERGQDLGIGPVDQGRNCIHGSAGPLEAVAELCRFLEISADMTLFGQQMLAAGADNSMIAGWMDNGLVNDLPAFDVTEELDAEESLTRLLG